jgi:tetratricopeptide (TPR) repeat protein
MTSPTPDTRTVPLEQAFRMAADHYAARRFASAAAILDRIVQAHPGHAPAWQMLAVMVHESGRTAEAIRLMDNAIKADPSRGQLFANRGELHRLHGDLEAAIADGEQAVKLAPGAAIAHSNLGIAWYDKGELDKAEACQRAALERDPRCLAALNNLGSIARNRKDRASAASFYRRVLDLQPDHVESANNLGAVLVEMEDPEAGLRHLAEVLRLRPGFPEAHCNVGHALIALEDYPRAESAFRQALALRPDYAEALEGLARCAQERHQLDEAEACARQALALNERAATWVLLGGIHAEQSYTEPSRAAYDRAIALQPDLVGAWMGKGHLLMEIGKLDEAEACFLHALALEPAAMAPRLALAQVRKTRPGDDNLAALEEVAKDIAAMPATRAISLHYALGKCYDDLKRHDEAFPHFLAGAALKRARMQYSAENNQLIAGNLRAQFTPETLQRLQGAGNTDATPIFVLGMPRSGTTLTETIIASHPDVHGAGELPDLLHLIGRELGTPALGYPLNVRAMTPQYIASLGQRYVEQLRKRAPASPRITDKMPANFLAVGMIHLMLPNAKIVHVRRNPVDTCLSAFTKLFNRSQPQSYDLRELGRYYRDYLAIMAHWRAVLPADAFYEIQYEDLVANQEEESRKLIAYCGLEWDNACLDPHKTERTVKTASITQVRQPVYTSSVERWRVYEKFLGPLLEALADAAPRA